MWVVVGWSHNDHGKARGTMRARGFRWLECLRGHACLVLLWQLHTAHVARSQGLTAHVRWTADGAGEFQPRLAGMPAPGGDGRGEPPRQDRLGGALTTDSASFEMQVSPDGENCPSPGELSPGQYGKAVALLGVRCKACAERADFVEAAQIFLSRLSVRSLKNILSVRGAGCRVCRTREDLQMACLHAATLPPKNVSLPLFDTSHVPSALVRCYPRGIVRLKVVEHRHQVLQQLSMESSQRFALLQGPKHAVVAKILEHGEQDGTPWVKVRCHQRVKILTRQPVPALPGIEAAHGFLFVDAPVLKRDASNLDHLQRRVRRQFFALDNDASAQAREDSIGVSAGAAGGGGARPRAGPPPPHRGGGAGVRE